MPLVNLEALVNGNGKSPFVSVDVVTLEGAEWFVRKAKSGLFYVSHQGQDIGQTEGKPNALTLYVLAMRSLIAFLNPHSFPRSPNVSGVLPVQGFTLPENVNVKAEPLSA